MDGKHSSYAPWRQKNCLFLIVYSMTRQNSAIIGPYSKAFESGRASKLLRFRSIYRYKNCRIIRSLFLTLLLILPLSCSGYRFVDSTDLPFREIAIRKVENLTVEPGLEDSVRVILHRTLTENGFQVSLKAERILDIEIRNYRMITLSEISLRTYEYRVYLEIKASLYDREGNLLGEFMPQLPYAVTFRTPIEPERLIIQKRTATEHLIRELCQEIVRKIIFN